MQVVVMRHGERNDQPCYDRGFIGQGLELAPLTDNGVKQAEEAAKIPLIDGCSIIVSSPYTRCMQTAAIVSRIRNIPLQVEVEIQATDVFIVINEPPNENWGLAGRQR